MHQDRSATKAGAGGGHSGVPEVTADIVDNLGTSVNRETGGGGVEGVYRENGGGLCLEDGFDGGKDACMFFVGRERSRFRTRGFAADVEDIGSFLEHLEGLTNSAVGSGLWGVEVAAVRERVRSDIEDAHDDCPLAER